MMSDIDSYLAATRQLLHEPPSDAARMICDLCLKVFSGQVPNPKIVMLRTTSASCELVSIGDTNYIIFDSNLIDALVCLNSIYYAFTRNDDLMRSFTVNYFLDRLSGVQFLANPDVFHMRTVNLLSGFSKRVSLAEIASSTLAQDRQKNKRSLDVVLVPIAFVICHELSHAAFLRDASLRKHWLNSAKDELELYTSLFAKQLKGFSNHGEALDQQYGAPPGSTAMQMAMHLDRLFMASNDDPELLEEIACDMYASMITLRIAQMSKMPLPEAGECVALSLRNLRAIEIAHDLCDRISSSYDIPAANEIGRAQIRISVNRREIADRCASFAVLGEKMHVRRHISKAEQKLYDSVVHEVAQRLVASSMRYEQRIDDYLLFRFKEKFAKFARKRDG